MQANATLNGRSCRRCLCTRLTLPPCGAERPRKTTYQRSNMCQRNVYFTTTWLRFVTTSSTSSYRWYHKYSVTHTAWNVAQIPFNSQILYVNFISKLDIVSWFAALTHLPCTESPPFWQTTNSNPFSWMKMIDIRLECLWNLFPGVQLIISWHWFK